PYPLISGSVIRCRPVGMLNMSDEAGPDAKILAVPLDALTDLYRDVSSFCDLPASMLAQIAHFFEHYKDLEVGKWVKVEGWLGPEEAKAEIVASVARYQAEPDKPQF
ncbi:MAG: inorganic pyrophosphatase, partial [Gammaproteobacteria bacterium]|nr:inorganic pyrophosphatase [Gammaproteobacteria bacterium]